MMKRRQKKMNARRPKAAREPEQAGNWYGAKTYVGLHFDLHANESDTELGGAKLVDLVHQLKIMSPDFAQTDCKGHPGITSWFSKVCGATEIGRAHV